MSAAPAESHKMFTDSKSKISTEFSEYPRKTFENSINHTVIFYYNSNEEGDNLTLKLKIFTDLQNFSI